MMDDRNPVYGLTYSGDMWCLLDGGYAESVVTELQIGIVHIDRHNPPSIELHGEALIELVCALCERAESMGVGDDLRTALDHLR
jgi:hypothetical protein